MKDYKNTKSKIVIYQVLTRLFGNTNTYNKSFGTIEENGCGKLNDINDKALASLKKLGITHMWYTGIVEHASTTSYAQYKIQSDHPEVVKGLAGSPYAIKDYYDVHPDLATNVPDRMMEFQNLINRTHKHQLKVIIDFVPNHVARQYHSDAKPKGIEDFGAHDDPSVAFHPDNNFYYLKGPFKVPVLQSDIQHAGRNKYYENPAKATGNDVFEPNPSADDWYDTIKLNYGIDYANQTRHEPGHLPDTWQKMLHILQHWAALGIDGFRCDMANMVPVEFWAWVIPQIKKQHPNIIFIAEMYVPDEYELYLNKGLFDYVYDKIEWYDTLRKVLKSDLSPSELTTLIQKQIREGRYERMLRFLENHDEQRIASEKFIGNAMAGLPMFAITTFMSNGPVMLYFGQEIGEPALGSEGHQGDDGRTTIFDYWGLPVFHRWVNNHHYDGGELLADQKELRLGYEKILSICHKYSDILQGEWIDIQCKIHSPQKGLNNEKVFCFIRKKEIRMLLVVANLGINDLPELEIELPEVSPDTSFTDLISNESITMKPANRLVMSLNPYHTRIIYFENKYYQNITK